MVKTVLTRPQPVWFARSLDRIFYEYGVEKPTNQSWFRHKYNKTFVSTPFGERIRNPIGFWKICKEMNLPKKYNIKDQRRLSQRQIMNFLQNVRSPWTRKKEPKKLIIRKV